LIVVLYACKLSKETVSIIRTVASLAVSALSFFFSFLIGLGLSRFSFHAFDNNIIDKPTLSGAAFIISRASPVVLRSGSWETVSWGDGMRLY
jgi:hypothetical protein